MQNLYRRAFQQASCGLLLIGADGNVADINTRALQMLGYATDALPRSLPLSELADSLPPADAEFLRRSFQDGTEQSGETVCYSTDGSEYPVRYLFTPCRREDNIIEGLFITLEDMKNEEQHRSRLQQRESRYRSLFESSSDPIIFLDSRGIIREANASTFALIDRDESEVLGKHFFRFVAPHSAENAKSEIAHFFYFGTLSIHTAEIEVSGKNEDILVDARIRRFYEHGRHTGYIINIRDIREAKEVEESLRKNIDTYKALLREIHHRIKNNLSLIISLINLRAGDFTDAKSEALMHELKHRIMSITLLHEKLYRGDSFTSVYLPDYITALTDHLIKSLNHTGNVPVDVSFDLQEVECPHDVAVPLGLILTELITNAVKYAFPEDRRKGTIEIRLQRKGKDLQLLVKDDGQGMPEPIVPRQSNSLGYKLIESLTQQIAGELSIDNRDGTSIQLTFPNAPTQS